MLQERHSSTPSVRYYDHHMAHTAAAYFTSEYDHSDVVAVDGRGGLAQVLLGPPAAIASPGYEPNRSPTRLALSTVTAHFI